MTLATAQGWIKLHRQITENEFWFSERFTRSQAWIDLLVLASHKSRTLFVRGTEINLKPGDLCYSQLSLAGRWQWNRKTVMSFLTLLKKREMILIKTDKRLSHLTTVITIRNWSEHQADGQLSGQRNGQWRDNGTDTNNNENNVQNVEKKDGDFPTPDHSGENLNQNINEIVGAWNGLAERHKLSKVSKITPTREKGIIARLKNADFNMVEMIRAMEEQPFLFGENDRGWSVDFDWIFLHPDNYVKVMERKYKNATASTNLTRRTGSSQTDRAQFRHSEEEIHKLRELEATMRERDRQRDQRTQSH